MHLISVMDDVLDVYKDDERIAEIALMADGWALYLVGPTGFTAQERVGTYDNIMRALMALKTVR